MNKTRSRIAVVGAGSIGKRHFQNLQQLGAEAVLVPWRQFSTGDGDALGELDGLVIATSTPIRRVLIEFCVHRDIPFYVEKPLGWSVEEVAALHELAQPVADRSMVGFMMRYHPALRDVAEGDLSHFYGFSMEIGHDVRQWRENWSFAGSYASKAEGGGVLLDLCHELDMAIALFPDLVLKRCDALGHADFPGVDMASFVQVASPEGLVGRIQMDYLSPVSIRQTAIRGLDHHLIIDFLQPSVARAETAGSYVKTYEFERNDMFLDAMRDFLALVQGQEASGNPMMPRFDRMAGSSEFIAQAWRARSFNGSVDFNLD